MTEEIIIKILSDEELFLKGNEKIGSFFRLLQVLNILKPYVAHNEDIYHDDDGSFFVCSIEDITNTSISISELKTLCEFGCYIERPYIAFLQRRLT
jgi:hypothetical protein